MKLTIKILVAAVLAIAGLFTWSDFYYSKLATDYTLLMDAPPLHGVITGYKVHWKHAYLTVDSVHKIHILPTESKIYQGQYFHDVIAVGDSIYKDRNSDELFVHKNGAFYKFRNIEPPVKFVARKSDKLAPVL